MIRMEHKHPWVAAVVSLGICLTIPLAGGADGQQSLPSGDRYLADVERMLEEVLRGDVSRGIVAPSDGETSLIDYGRGNGNPIPISAHNLGLIAAADNIVNLQCPVGGWDWPWEDDCSDPPTNIGGQIVPGLVAAYLATGDSTYIDSAAAGGDFFMTNDYPNGNPRFGSFDPWMFHELSQASGDSTYSDHAAVGFFDSLDASTYGPDSDWDTAEWIQVVKNARSGSLINLRPWEFHTIAWTAGVIGQSSQQDLFRDAIIDGLETTDEAEAFDLLALAAGVRGLAMISESSWTPALSSPNAAYLQGIDNLCDLADVLLSLQNTDGSWSWRADLQNAGGTAPDTQTTSYAVLALLAAQDAGCGPYEAQIDAARAWIWSMQDDSDGAFLSFPGGGKNISVQGEAILAAGAPGDVSLVSDACVTDGTLTVMIDKSETPSTEVFGGQFFLEYDTSVLSNPAVFGGDAPFDNPPFFVDIDQTAGTIDIGTAGGDPFTNPQGTEDAVTMAVITFNAAEVCTQSDLVTFRAHDPPTRLTDGVGNSVPVDLFDLPDVTIDGTAPVITAPSAIMVDADAGFCSAMVDLFNTQTETFDTNPDLNEWIVDRFEPACFETAFFDGDNRLKLCIDEADAQGGSGFTNTQGRKIDPLPSTSITTAEIDLYVPSNWATTDRRMAGFWLRGNEGAFPILEFTSGTPGFESTTDDPANSGNPEPRFRGWSSATGWVDMGLPTGFQYDEWHTLTITLSGSTFTYEVGDLSLTLPTFGDQYFEAVFIQGYNTHTDFGPGVTYDIHWDDFAVQEMPAIVSDNCDPNPTITATRDDNEPLDAPYPSGTTVITWTAEDGCGNVDTDTQEVVVSGNNLMFVDVELQATVESGPFDRCVEFELTDVDGNVVETVSETLTFTNGQATATIEVPCGDYGDCIAARDPLHTLRSIGDLTIVGTEYDAFVDDGLRGGDLNDDGVIDILDFGTFVFQFGQSLNPDTDCNTAAPHADITGNGQVGTGDFNFIQINFLQMDDVCPVSVMAGQRGFAVQPNVTPKPRTRISVRELHELGLGHLEVADLTGDGWVGPQDIAAFAAGARPE